MSQQKEVLDGIVTLGMNVKSGEGDAGLLSKGDKVKISDDYEVEEIDTAQDEVFGYILVANKEDSGKCTVTTRGKRVTTETTGAAYSAGDFVNFSAAGKVVKAASARATGTVTIQDFSAVDNGDTVTVNGVVLTAGGTDWTQITSNAAAAISLAGAINDKVPGVKATPSAGVVTIEALDSGKQGNAITLATSMTAVTEGTVSGATLTGGKEFFPMGIALEAATGADESKDVLWF